MKQQTVILTIFLSVITHFGFSQLTEYTPFEIIQDSIHTIKEWEIIYDTTGNVTDTILDFEFIYNEKGDLLEKRNHFNNNYSMYISTTYKYDDKHNIIESKYNNPYFITDGVYVKPPETKCETLNKYGKPIKTTLNFSSGTIENWTFDYIKKRLIEKRIYVNGKLSTVYKIEYTFY